MCKKMVITKVQNGVIHYTTDGKHGWVFRKDFLDEIAEIGPFELLFKNEGVRDQTYALEGIDLIKILEAMGV